jgi:translation initiation factor IF-1
MLVQCTGGTSSGNFNKRVAKIRAEPRHAIWLASGGRIQVHSWELRVDTKERALRTLEITPLTTPV